MWHGGFGKWITADTRHGTTPGIWTMANTDCPRRLRALVAKREWNEIEEIARAKRSPIGWQVSNSRVNVRRIAGA